MKKLKKAQKGGGVKPPVITSVPDNTRVLSSSKPKDNSKKSIEQSKKVVGANTMAIDEYNYYNPPYIKGITSGDANIDFLYNNQYLMDAPILGDYIKGKARESAIASGGAATIDKNDDRIGGGYDGTISSEASDINKKKKPTLLDQYFSKEDLFEKAPYKPSSDYLPFLPTYSVKGKFKDSNSTFKDVLSDTIDEYQSDQERKVGKNPNDEVIARGQSRIDSVYNKFITDKQPIYQANTEDGALSNMLDVNLAGHKTGLAWDNNLNLPYASISDAWDFEPNHYGKKWGIDGDKKSQDQAYIQSSLMHKAGKPFKIYDRFYFDPKTKKYIPNPEKKQTGGEIINMVHKSDMNQHDRFNPQKRWMTDWYNNPETKERLVNNLQDSSTGLEAFQNFFTPDSSLIEQPLKNTIDKINKAKVIYAKDPKFESDLQQRVWDAEKRDIEEQNYLTTSTSGSYAPDNNVLMVNRSYEFATPLRQEDGSVQLFPTRADTGFENTTAVHELSHASELPALMDDLQKVKNINYNNKKKGNAAIGPGETYPRIMEMRYLNNLKPGQIVDQKLLNQIKIRERTDNKNGNSLIDYYSDKDLLKMFNTFASNDSDSIPKAQKGGSLESNSAPKNWMVNYMDSETYDKRLKNFSDNVPITKESRQDLLNTNYISQPGDTARAYHKESSNLIKTNPEEYYSNIPGKYFKYGVHNINISPNFEVETHKSYEYPGNIDPILAKAPLRKDDLLAHELSHMQRRTTEEENGYITSKARKSKLNDHDGNPFERKADLDAFRYQMYRKGIYDTSERDMTIEDFNKAKSDPEISKSFLFQRLLKSYTPKAIVNMNNTIAYNGSDSIPQAQNGKSIPNYKPIGVAESTRVDPSRIAAPHVDMNSDVMQQYLKTEKDPKKVETLKSMLLKYGNPDISYGYIPEDYDGYNNIFSNGITIPRNKQSSGDISDIILTELSHSKQFKDNGTIPTIGKMLTDLPTYIKDRKSVYDQVGSMEYDAHRIIEPGIRKEYSQDLYQKKFRGNYPELSKKLYPTALDNLYKKQEGGAITNTGYLNDSPDRFNDYNIIPSNQITMQNVSHPVYGVDDLGNEQMMYPGQEYEFPGNYVTEYPMKKKKTGGVVDSGKPNFLKKLKAQMGMQTPDYDQNTITPFYSYDDAEFPGTDSSAPGTPAKNTDPRQKDINQYLSGNKLLNKMGSNIMSSMIDPGSLYNTIGYAGAGINMINNAKTNRRQEDWFATQQNSDNLFPVQPGGDRGDYVVNGTGYGQFRPDQLGSKSPDGTTGMYYQTGGVVQDQAFVSKRGNRITDGDLEKFMQNTGVQWDSKEQYGEWMDQGLSPVNTPTGSTITYPYGKMGETMSQDEWDYSRTKRGYPDVYSDRVQGTDNFIPGESYSNAIRNDVKEYRSKTNKMQNGGITSVQDNTKVYPSNIIRPSVKGEGFKNYSFSNPNYITDAIESLILENGNPQINQIDPSEPRAGFDMLDNTMTIGSSRGRTEGQIIAELAHAKQRKEKGILGVAGQYFSNDLPALFSNGFNKRKLYNINGTIENEAHSIYEPRLIEEFEKRKELGSENGEIKKIMIRQGTKKEYGGQAGFALDLDRRPVANNTRGNGKISRNLSPVDEDEANIEAELGETIFGDFDQDGINEHMTIGGKRHSQGGTPLNAPPASFIYSDTKKMKIGGEILADFGKSENTKRKYTPAELAKQYDVNKYKAILDDKDSDPVKRRTAEMMIENYNNKLGQLALVQEAKKGFPDGLPEVAIPYLMTQTTPEGLGELSQGSDQNTFAVGGTYNPLDDDYTEPYPGGKTKKGTTTPTGKKNPYNRPKSYLDNWEEIIPGIKSMDNAKAQGLIYDYNLTNNPQSIRDMWTTYGNTAKGLRDKGTKGLSVNGKFTDENLTPETLGKLKSAYTDGYFGVRQMDPMKPNELPPNIPGGPVAPPSGPPAKIIPPAQTPKTTDPNEFLATKGQQAPTDFWTQDKINVASAFQNRGNLNKYMPWAAPVTGVQADPTFYDPNRELANNAELMNTEMMYANQFSGPQSTGVRNSAVSGNAATNAANILGRYNNQNVGVANEFEMQNTQFANQLSAAQNARVNTLYQGNVIANQQFDNSKAQSEDVIRKNLLSGLDNKQKAQWINSWYPQFDLDPASGYINFAEGTGHSGVTAASGSSNSQDYIKMFKELRRQNPDMSEDVIKEHLKRLLPDARNTVTSDGDMRSTSRGEVPPMLQQLMKFTR